MTNALSIDVEDYFQVEAFTDVIDREKWESYPSRVVANTKLILAQLHKADIKATFFVLGWVARRYPELVTEIHRAGHEVASHGYSHRLIYTQSPNEFRKETKESKDILEDIIQEPVIGYRAATYSITKDSLWALDILAEEGFEYDSSIFPMRHDRYGICDINHLPHLIRTENYNSIVEFPISIAQWGKVKIPVAGGGYFRLFPYFITRWGLKRIEKKGGFVFYLHPWEVDPDQPVIEDASLFSKFRHYNNLARCQSRLNTLVNEFEFNTVRQSLTDRGLLTIDGRKVG